MKCAQCEQAEASIRCVQEKLDYCQACSHLLHSKRARSHHQLEAIVASRVCDECETAAAKLECLDCGGGKLPLVFCFECCSSLHSRAARASHSIHNRGFITPDPVKAEASLPPVAPKKTYPVNPLPGKSGPRVWIDSTGDDEHKRANSKSVKEENCSVEKTQAGGQFGDSKPNAVPGKPADVSSTNSENECESSGKCKQEPEKQLYSQSNRGRSGLPLAKLSVRGHDLDGRPSRAARLNGEDRRRVEVASDVECSSDEATSDSDEEFHGTRTLTKGSVTVEAFIVDATDQDGADITQADEAPDEAGSGIRFKIRKMLELGLHPDTPDTEAQQALKNAQRLLTKHNLQQAEVLRGNLADASTLLGGMRVVELRTTGKAKQGRMESWVLELGWVISDYFDVQFFFETGTSTKPQSVVFYGISQNADCAGYAFAAIFNRITRMSAQYLTRSRSCYGKADKENRDAKSLRRNQGVETRVARSNYRRGVVAGLKEAVLESRKVRHEAAKPDKDKEESKPFTVMDTEGDSTQEDGDGSCPGHEQPVGESKPDDRCTVITALVQHSKTVGEEYLRSKGIKVQVRNRKMKNRAWNQDAFTKGKQDSKTIDINQKAIACKKGKRRKRS